MDCFRIEFLSNFFYGAIRALLSAFNLPLQPAAFSEQLSRLTLLLEIVSCLFEDSDVLLSVRLKEFLWESLI